MTIYDIAKEAGVAASTVSRVINNKPGIKAETREKVRQLLEKYNFTPDVAARGLVMQSSRIIGILLQDIRVVHHIDSAYVVEQAMTKQGYCCITMSTGPTEDKMAEYIRILGERRVEGVILIGSMFSTERVMQSILEYLPDVPVVMVNGYLDLPNVYGVIADEMGGIQECVKRLFSKGKKKLAYINDADSPSNSMKLLGFKTAMKEVGCTDLWIYHTRESSMPAAVETTKLVMAEHPDVEGILYSIDLTAVGGIRALHELGIQVPRQVAITGVDNTIYGEICEPRLTTLDNRQVDMSTRAAEILLKALNGKESEHQQFFETYLIERGSI